MLRRVLTSGLALAAAGLFTVAVNVAGPAAAYGGERGDYIVVLADTTADPGAAAAGHAARYSGAVGHVYRHALKGFSVSLSGAAAAALRRAPGVVSVERDQAVTAFAQTVPTGVKRIFADQNPDLDIDGSDDVRVDADIARIAVYNNKGGFVAKYDLPTGKLGDVQGDGYGYDVAINPSKNVLLTSSFTGRDNYMRDLGGLVADQAAMKKFGNTMVLWDLKAMQPRQIFSVPGAPLEIRWSLKPGDNWAITAAALTSKLWLVKQDAAGKWQAKDVGTIGDPSKIPLPVDISITADGKGLWVNTFMDGMTRYFDLTDPEAPKQTYAKQTGRQVNMISQSWDGKRVYITSSLLARWDKGGADNEQFVRAFHWDGKELKPAFEVDFTKEQLGRAHHMKFSARAATAAR